MAPYQFCEGKAKQNRFKRRKKEGTPQSHRNMALLMPGTTALWGGVRKWQVRADQPGAR